MIQERWFVLSPNDARPGGPVLFTDPSLAYQWLAWQEERGQPLVGAEVKRTLGTLQDCIEIWRELFMGLGYQPKHYSVCIINPRRAVHPAHDCDGEALPFDSVFLPEGVIRPDHK